MLGNTCVSFSDKTVRQDSNPRRTLSVRGIWLFVTKPFSEVLSSFVLGPGNSTAAVRGSECTLGLHSQKQSGVEEKVQQHIFFNVMIVLTPLLCSPSFFPAN